MFDSAHIKNLWPKKNDEFLIQWPTQYPIFFGSAQVIVAIQKSSE